MVVHLKNCKYVGFPKWGCPQIIHLNGIFPSKPSMLGTPFRKPPYPHWKGAAKDGINGIVGQWDPMSTGFFVRNMLKPPFEIRDISRLWESFPLSFYIQIHLAPLLLLLTLSAATTSPGCSGKSWARLQGTARTWISPEILLGLLGAVWERLGGWNLFSFLMWNIPKFQCILQIFWILSKFGPGRVETDQQICRWGSGPSYA